MADETDRLYDLRDEFDLARQRFRHGAETEDRGEAADPSGTVRVECVRSELTILVRISNDWAHDLEPESLGSVIVATYAEIGYKALGAWSEAVISESGDERVTPLSPRGGTVAARVEQALTAGAERPSLDEVMANISELIGQLGSAFAAATTAVADRATAQYDGSTYAGHVTATVNGEGELVRIALSPSWARRTSGSGY